MRWRTGNYKERLMANRFCSFHRDCTPGRRAASIAGGGKFLECAEGCGSAHGANPTDEIVATRLLIRGINAATMVTLRSSAPANVVVLMSLPPYDRKACNCSRTHFTMTLLFQFKKFTAY